MADAMPLPHLSSSLKVSVGQHSCAGVKAVNEDAIGIRIPDGPALAAKGIVAVLADGVSAAEGGREASATAVTSFISDYYSTHETWSVEHSASKVLSALNQWLYGLSTRFISTENGYVTTFSAAVFKAASAYLFHIGDSRIYLIRNGELEQLTRDHTTRVGGNQSYLTRALGIDVHLDVDFHRLDLLEGDLFVFTTDGVHNWLGRNDILDVCAGAAHHFQVGTLDSLCQKLVETAKANGSDDNLSVQLVRIQQAGEPSRRDLLAHVSRLPFPPSLQSGHKIDGWTVVREIHASSRSEVYLVEKRRSGEQAVLKAPSVNFEDDAGYVERFILEEWIGSRISSSNVVKVIRQPEKKFLYYLTEYAAGPTLGQLLKERSRLSVVDAQNIITQVISGLRAFHRRDVLHQDIKPDNIIYTDQGVKIIDFGACLSAGVAEIRTRMEEAPPGTRDYSAPEYLLNGPISTASDQFSLGVLCYELLTGRHPFGEAYHRCRTEADFARLKYIPAHRLNPLVPGWLDGAIHKALSIDPGRRYPALSEFAQDLKTPNPTLSAHRPLSEEITTSVRFWKTVVVLLALTNMVTLMLWLKG